MTDDRIVYRVNRIVMFSAIHLYSAVAVAAIGLVVLIYLLCQDRKRIRESDQELSWKVWLKWRVWTVQRLYRQLKSYLIVGKISSHIFLVKSVIAFGLIAVLMFLMQDSGSTRIDQKILVAATTFYATTIYLDDRFQFAALRHRNQDVTLLTPESYMGMVMVLMDLYNDGATVAEYVEAEMRVIDPIRNCHTHSHKAEMREMSKSEEEVTDPLQKGHSREIRLAFDASKSEIERIRMNDTFDNNSWAEIRISSPEQVTPTWIFIPLRNIESVKPDDAVEGLKAMKSALEIERERVLGETDTGNNDN